MWIFTRQKKSNSNENMLFWRKTDETIWNPPLSKRTPPFPLTPLLLSNFFMIPLFVQISKTRTPPNFMGEETMMPHAISSFDRRRVFALNAHTYRKQCVNFYWYWMTEMLKNWIFSFPVPEPFQIFNFEYSLVNKLL